jgi:hypothetical protein
LSRLGYFEHNGIAGVEALADELAALIIGKGRDDSVCTDVRGGVLRNSNWRARVFDAAVKKLSEGRRHLPDHHATRPPPHSSQPCRQFARQCEGGSADAWSRHSLDDAGHLPDLFDEELDGVRTA